MLYRIAKIIRDKFHPLWHLRRYKFFRIIQKNLDVPVSVRLYKIGWKVRVRLLRHMLWILGSSSFEPGVTSHILAINKIIKPRIFWDIGANIGYYSWLLMSHNKDIQVVLFECDPDNVDLLKQTIEHAKLENAQVITKAVSDKDGEDAFIVDDISGVTGALKGMVKSDKQKSVHNRYHLSKTITVKTVTLDSVQHNLKPPDLIKIDAEGVEKRIFDGGAKLIKNKQPIIIFECLSARDKMELVSELRNLNYDIFNAEDINNDIDRADCLLALPFRYKDLSEKLFNEYRKELENRMKV